MNVLAIASDVPCPQCTCVHSRAAPFRWFANVDFDAATAIGFLRQYGLDKDFKMNIEANHATLAGHTFQHELRISAINGMLGSIDANQGDLLLGWDTDEFPANVYEATMCMYEVLKAGGLTVDSCLNAESLFDDDKAFYCGFNYFHRFVYSLKCLDV